MVVRRGRNFAEEVHRAMRRIEPYRLWVGHAGDGRDFRRLFEHGIEAVVQLAAEEPTIAVPRELVLLRIPLVDGGNRASLGRLAVEAVSDLVRDGVPTLVCCGAGMSRSPAVVAVALSSFEGVSADEMLARVASGGPADVSPSLWASLRGVAG